MCLAIPARIVSIDLDGETARVAIGEIHKDISLVLVDGVEVGEYVLIHVGYALATINSDEAEKTLALFAAAGYSCNGAG